MEIIIKQVNKNEILKNLRYRGSEIPPDIDALIEECISELKSRIKGKYIMDFLDMYNPLLSELIIGEDTKRLLSDSTKVILMAVTLGQEIEMLIRKYSYSDITKSVVMDAVASAGVESLANDINDMLIEEYAPMYLTDRFSPGYGDLPIGVNVKLLRVLNGTKKIGLTTSETGIMIPRKSITAIIGVSENPQPHRYRGCENCRLYRECEFVKRGETCGYDK